jgi:endonuclease/exonuclease/phosphatase family metal-dependent hydrolase
MKRDIFDTSDPDKINYDAAMSKIRSSNACPNPAEVISNLKFVSFNVEKGRHLNEIEAYLKYHPSLRNADVIFFNELDDGMARTGNIDITAELSKRLSMNYIFGVEFIELTPENIKYGSKDFSGSNTKGLHGNSILSRFELLEPTLIRLPTTYDWFYDNRQKRIGGRMALFAKIKVNNQLIGLVCTHLENRTSPSGREKQIKFMLECINDYFIDMPVIIAGDMNSNTCDGSIDEEFTNLYEKRQSQSERLHSPEKSEPLFKLLKDSGFNYENANVDGKVTRRKPINKKGVLELNLDWFFTRGLICTEPKVVETFFSSNELECMPSLDANWNEGVEISNHNAISVKCILKP